MNTEITVPRVFLRAVLRRAWFILFLMHGFQAGAHPLPDVLLFGKVFTPAGQQLTDTLPGAILVKKTMSPSGETVASTSVLLTPGGETADTYYLRIPRMSADAAPAVHAVKPGDQFFLFLDANGNGVAEAGEAVAETAAAGLLVSDAPREIRYVSLNRPNADVDADGLPDDWEQQHFASLAPLPANDPNLDGVSNLLALASGLSPLADNSSRMPFVRVEQAGTLSLYFQRSTTPRGASLVLESSDSLTAAAWSAVNGAAVTPVSVSGESTLFRAVLQGAPGSARKFYRLRAIPAP